MKDTLLYHYYFIAVIGTMNLTMSYSKITGHSLATTGFYSSASHSFAVCSSMPHDHCLHQSSWNKKSPRLSLTMALACAKLVLLGMIPLGYVPIHHWETSTPWHHSGHEANGQLRGWQGPDQEQHPDPQVPPWAWLCHQLGWHGDLAPHLLQ